MITIAGGSTNVGSAMLTVAVCASSPVTTVAAPQVAKACQNVAAPSVDRHFSAS